MRFAVESWSPDFGTSTEGDLDITSQQVDLSVEVPEHAWAPRTPPPGPHPARVLFVDGVRRVDARLWIDAAPVARPALCATIGAGVVGVEQCQARLLDARVVRAVFAHGVALAPIDTSCGTYAACPVLGDSPEALVLALQDRMALLEAEVTEAVGAGGSRDGGPRDHGGSADTVVLVDGPLRGRGQVPGAVGYVKTQHTNYLVPPNDAVIGALGAGQRTPLFAIGGPFPRMSWYVRLPGPLTHALAGVVRCEAALADAGLAAALADTVTSLLPRFASAPHKDSRAPQNLYPIAGLERALRRRLGDPGLLERSLRVAAARAVARGA